jgi:hypothetical protein
MGDMMLIPRKMKNEGVLMESISILRLRFPHVITR